MKNIKWHGYNRYRGELEHNTSDVWDKVISSPYSCLLWQLLFKAYQIGNVSGGNEPLHANYGNFNMSHTMLIQMRVHGRWEGWFAKVHLQNIPFTSHELCTSPLPPPISLPLHQHRVTQIEVSIVCTEGLVSTWYVPYQIRPTTTTFYLSLCTTTFYLKRMLQVWHKFAPYQEWSRCKLRPSSSRDTKLHTRSSSLTLRVKGLDVLCLEPQLL
jgi:hypothetical protein